MNYLHGPPGGPTPINYFAPSALDNQPRRIFNGFGADGSPLGHHAIPSGLFADDLANFDLDSLDHGDPKRRRIARACDMCRKKKIKCDGKMPSCTHCQNYKTECVFTQVEKKRNPPKGAKYIEGLENRLGRMESLLRLSGLLAEDESGEMDLGTLERKLSEKKEQLQNERKASPTEKGSPTGSEVNEGSVEAEEQEKEEGDEERQTDESKPKRKGGEVEALSDMMCSLVTNNSGETRYIGSSSGFSIFSPKGMQWVNEKTGDTSFQEMVTTTSPEDNKWVNWKPDVFLDIFARRIYRPLPPKAEALSLLRDYFQNFNCMFPLFHEPTFMHLVEKHYSRDPYEGSGWWASLNVVLAIAHRLRVMSNLVPQEEDEKAWGYLKNALAVQTELTIRNTDLLSVQALLGMALFLQGTPNPQPSFFLVAAAIRLAHSIGLHKKGSGFGLSQSEIEQRKRVFWIAYMVDKDICLRSGRPPVQDDDDLNVELPSEDPPDNIGNIPLADGKSKVNLFRLMCAFAVLQSKVYKQLYSVKASKQSDGELLNTIGQLDKELEEWKDGIPIDFRPEHEIKASHTPLILHVVVLHFAYYNCLTTIHRMSVHHGYWTSRLSNYAIQGLNARPLNPRIFSSAALCVSAARASIHLIKYIPQGDFDCVWMILYYPVSSLVTLFANILQNPQDARARSDLKLMNHVVNFLTMLCSDDKNSSIRRMLNICTEFERIANIVLDKSDKDASSRRKRKQHQSVDEGMRTFPNTPQAQHRELNPTTPKPSQPGNIPNVFTPPDMSKFFQDDPTNGLPQPTASSAPATQWLAPDATLPPTGLSPNYSPNPSTSPVSSTGLHPTSTSALNGGGGLTAGHAHQGHARHGHARHHSHHSVTNTGGAGTVLTPGPHHQHHQHQHQRTHSAVSTDPLNLSDAFQHPFVPQDLWQMPMTLEWDWADMTAGFGIEDPVAANGVLAGVPGVPATGMMGTGAGAENGGGGGGGF